jgi:hypothetical protein
MSGFVSLRSSLAIDVHSEVRGRVIELGEDYWRSLARTGKPPSRSDIDPLDIPNLMPQVILLDVQHEPWDFRFRLIGTNVVYHLSQDWTGQWMTQIPHMAPPSRIFTSCVVVASSGTPQRSEPPYVGPHQDFVTAEDTILPLSRDGDVIDMLMVFVEHFEKR